MADLRAHRAYLAGELAVLRASPLSRRKAMLVVGLIDAFVDRLFAPRPGADDLLAFRAEMAASAPALAQVMQVWAGEAQLKLEAVVVPLDEYGALSVEDFMVSLYNDHSVQRLRLVLADGQSLDALMVLEDAVGALDRQVSGGGHARSVRR